MSAILIWFEILLGQLILLLAAPFCRRRLAGVVWLALSLPALPLALNLASMDIVVGAWLTAQYLLAASVGALLLWRREPKLLFGSFLALAILLGATAGLMWGKSAASAVLSSAVLAGWVMAWRRRLLSSLPE